MATDIFKYLQPVSGQARECREATNHLVVVAVNNIVNSAYVSTYSLSGREGVPPAPAHYAPRRHHSPQ